MTMKTIDDLQVRGRRVLVRADLNVPLDGSRITGKICACLPTLNALLDPGASVRRSARAVAAGRLYDLDPDTWRHLTKGGRRLVG